MKPHALHTVLLAAALALTGGAHAELTGTSATGFTITHRHDVAATSERVYELIGDIGRWWHPDHTYSGQSSNLKLDLSAPGCFCERWDGNSIVHANVIYAQRGKAVRLEGALGPLQPLAVTAVLTITMASIQDRTRITWHYRVVGPTDAGLQELSAAVDRVIGEQAARLANAAGAVKP